MKTASLALALSLAVAGAAVPAVAQLALPPAGLPSLPTLDLPRDALGNALDVAVDSTAAVASRLLRARDSRIDRLLRRNRDAIELDDAGAPARRGEVLLLDPSRGVLDAAQAAGFSVAERDELGELGLSVVRLNAPRGLPLAQSQALLRRVAPGAAFAADSLHFQSGAGGRTSLAAAARAGSQIKTRVGIIDGAPGAQAGIASTRGFASGAPIASDHGSAIVSLLAGAGARDLCVADIYGTDVAGGSALALVRGLNWLLAQGARVISISLTGPNNDIVGKAIAAAQRRGAVIVAAVGNDGPAAPPAFPASYPGVVAVTAVDGHGRALIEAGRASHLDYAAPGADIVARNAAGRWVKVRGTSYAVPLVAARVAAALPDGNWRQKVDGEAIDLGPRGADAQFGRGLLCRGCARAS